MYVYFWKYLKFLLKVVVNHLGLNITWISLKINYRFEVGLQGCRHRLSLSTLLGQRAVGAEHSARLPRTWVGYLGLQDFVHLFILWFCFINALSITLLTMQNKSFKLLSSVKVFSIIHHTTANSSLFCSSACLPRINHSIRHVPVHILCSC